MGDQEEGRPRKRWIEDAEQDLRKMERVNGEDYIIRELNGENR